MREGVCPLARRFLSLARQEKFEPALRLAGRRTVTRGEVAHAALEVAAAVRPLLVPGRPVALSLPNSPELVAAFVGLRAAGAAVALVDATAPAGEVARCARAVGACLVVTQPGRTAEPVAAEIGGAVVARCACDPVAIPAGTAVLKLTSGSTGAPRAVAASARQLAADTVQIMRTMEVRAADVTLAAIPLTHSYGIGSCLVPLLLAGTPLVLPASPLPAALADAIAAERVAHFPAVPAMVRSLAGLGALPAPALRVCLSAGAPLRPEDAAAFHAATGVKVHVFYGASECGGITYDRGAAPVHAAGAVGSALERVTVEVVDAAGRPLPSGRQGSVRVRSRAVARGIVPAGDDGGTLGAGVFLTSDRGVLDERGCLTLTGRAAEQLNVAGKKVHPDEVRCVLEAVAGVRAAHVAGLPDAGRGTLVAAVVAVDRDAGLTASALLAACRARLAPHKVPRRIVLVEELPLNARGKLDRDAALSLLVQARAAARPTPAT
jgi:long-chain acyl-CoA synthetase